ncbi:hypothetical protein OSB04_020253 [Centaurea solstitialis]|uniref:non-specific serine/threonine protein kinase n=1 Tax=Centaurea solstitialis TaxID=347529 RepID=A0AA38SRV8_9ASTR|nr:hypothetical protein OSB04_020253 [Centaurea solstitialis]
MFMAYFSLFFHAIIALLSWYATLAIASLAGNNTDHLALLAIKSSITHDPQRVLDTWNTSLHFCQWQGVTCGHRHPRVTVLDLRSRGLVGSLPPHIENLSFLRERYGYTIIASTVAEANSQQIIGGLSKDIGLQLPNLMDLELWSNRLTGSLPSSISNCSNLKYLDLGDNGFARKVHINFRGIPNLTRMQLSANRLGSWEHDDMNFIDSMINCSNLEILDLGSNQLRGMLPSSIGNLSSQLTILDLDNNFIYGTVPSGIGNLVKLTVMALFSNQLTGIIPNEVGNLRFLVILYLDFNNFTGSLPDFLGNLSSLSTLALSDNTLQGQIPASLGKCKSLSVLRLSRNNFSGLIRKELFQPSALFDLDFSQNHLVGPLPHEIGNLKNLMSLNLSHNHLVGKIPDAIRSCTSLEYLGLAANSFEGLIPPAFRALRGIRSLDLSSNNFSGKIPIFLEQLNLSSLNLSFNNLDGEVPTRGIFKNASAIAICGNGRLCEGIRELGLPRCDMVARSKKGFRLILVVVPLFSSLVVLAIVLSLLFCWQRRKREAQPTEASHGQPFSRVSYGSIRKATNDFSERNLIGTGTFSVVYKGILEAGAAMVAIKVLKLDNQGALKSFMAECEALKNIRHRNLVKIITSCSSVDYQGVDFKALVYEFMPNGNLDTWLHPSQEQETDTEEATPRRLSLRQRVTIALDVAHAIHYLHQDCEIPIIHCDLKPNNILLDNDMVAHVGDFGLAKFLPLKPHESSSIGIRGTIGYAAPEYGLGSEMTKEGDIYSFGIMLLEMMTGKRPTDKDFAEGSNLHDYVKTALPNRDMEIIEPTILHALVEDEARKWKRLEDVIISLCRMGLACSTESPRERMDASKIVHELHRINAVIVASI